eukprot:811013-Rhodomonas_salina.1
MQKRGGAQYLGGSRGPRRLDRARRAYNSRTPLLCQYRTTTAVQIWGLGTLPLRKKPGGPEHRPEAVGRVSVGHTELPGSTVPKI